MSPTKLDQNKFEKLVKLIEKYLNYSKSLQPITINRNPNLLGLLIELHHVNTQTMLSIIHVFGMAHTNDILTLSVQCLNQS